MNDKVIVETHQLSKVYGDGVHVCALDAVSLAVREGEFLAVMGPSGSGKSTLLHLIGALDRPTSGRVTVGGHDLATVKRLDRFRSQTVGFVFQLHHLIPTLTVRENLEVPLYETMRSRRARRQRAQEILALVGLTERMNHLPSQLSGGQRQKVAIGRALVNSPLLILADEPTGNLDSASGQGVIALLRELNEHQGTTVIVVTHDPAVARQTRRVVTLRDGKVLWDEPVKNLYLEDLRDFKHSHLGRVLMQDAIPSELGDLGLQEIAPQFKEILAQV